jgi:threonine/homoserine/homoserine lactone efflux protein
MTPGQTFAFLLFAVVAAITPGPSNLLVTSTGAAVGLLRGLPCLGGVVIGIGLLMFLVAFGLGGILLASPALFLLLKLSGIGFLFWLAWQIASAGHSDATAERQPLGFVGAAALQWINPKSWLVSVSAVSAYAHPKGGNVLWQAGVLGLLFLVAALPSCFIWLAFGSKPTTLATHGTHRADLQCVDGDPPRRSGAVVPVITSPLRVLPDDSFVCMEQRQDMEFAHESAAG